MAFFPGLQPASSFKASALAVAAALIAAALASAKEPSPQNQTIEQIGAEVRKTGNDLALPPTSHPLPPLGSVRSMSLAQAIALTLQKDPNIVLSQESVTIARGQLRQAAGPFDPTVTASVSRTYQKDQMRTQQTQPATSQDQLATILNQAASSPSLLSSILNNGTLSSAFAPTTSPTGTLTTTSSADSLQENTQGQLQISKTFRSGITLTPSVQYSSDALSQTGSTSGDFTGLLGFSLQVPLLRGLGPNSSNAATERAARINVEATKLTLAFTVSQEVFNTISAYWNCLLAQETVRVALSNENSALRLTEITEALIKGYIQPEFSLVQAQANLEQYRSQRIVAEQQQAQASQALAVAIGLSAKEVLSEPLAVQGFPSPPKRANLKPAVIQNLVQLALQRRQDLQSARLNEKVNYALLQGAKNNALPQINAALGAALQRAGNRQQIAQTDNSSTQVGAGVAGMVSIQWPLLNDAAEGSVIQQRGQLGQARTQVYSQESQIASAVITAAKAVINTEKALEAAESAVAKQMKTVQGQETLFSMGMSTLVEVITTQTNLTNAQLNLIQNQSNYAIALAQIRFATGTLMNTTGTGTTSLNPRDMLTLPILSQK